MLPARPCSGPRNCLALLRRQLSGPGLAALKAPLPPQGDGIWILAFDRKARGILYDSCGNFVHILA